MSNRWSGLSFDNYMKLVDSELVNECGMDHDDLPDCCYTDWHQQGIHPTRAAKRALRNAKEG